MRQPPQGQSIWGTINTCIEIALNVYAIIAKDRDGRGQQDFMKKAAPEKRRGIEPGKPGRESAEQAGYNQTARQEEEDEEFSR